MSSSSSFSRRAIAAKYSTDYRLYIEDDKGQVVSPFHDIPLYADKTNGIVNMICEIPRFTNAKLEISKDEPMNPIKQDMKKGALRFIKNVFPYHGYIWNYGALPQTWESPLETDPNTNCSGDNDPLDVIEIGNGIMKVGEVRQVKVLGVMALLDEGETDWKVIVIDTKDPLASKLNDASELGVHCPGLVEATRDWFTVYKIPDGKPENVFAFNGTVKDRAFALNIIESTHKSWKRLINKELPNKTDAYNISTINRNVEGSPYQIKSSSDDIVIPKPANESAEKALDKAVHDWAYLKRS